MYIVYVLLASFAIRHLIIIINKYVAVNKRALLFLFLLHISCSPTYLPSRIMCYSARVWVVILIKRMDFRGEYRYRL